MEGFCEFLSDSTDNQNKISQVNFVLRSAGIPEGTITLILECLDQLGIIDFPSDSALSDLPSASADSPELTASEKIEQLKTQWLDLLS